MTMDPQVPRSQHPQVWAALRGLLRIQAPVEGMIEADGRSNGSVPIQDSPALAARRKRLDEVYATGMTGCPGTSGRPTIYPHIDGGWEEVYPVSSTRECVHCFDAEGRQFIQRLQIKAGA